MCHLTTAFAPEGPPDNNNISNGINNSNSNSNSNGNGNGNGNSMGNGNNNSIGLRILSARPEGSPFAARGVLNF